MGGRGPGEGARADGGQVPWRAAPQAAAAARAGRARRRRDDLRGAGHGRARAGAAAPAARGRACTARARAVRGRVCRALAPARAPRCAHHTAAMCPSCWLLCWRSALPAPAAQALAAARVATCAPACLRLRMPVHEQGALRAPVRTAAVARWSSVCPWHGASAARVAPGGWPAPTRSRDARRAVLDEAHTIRNYSTQARGARAGTSHMCRVRAGLETVFAALHS